MEAVTDFIFLGSKITADGDCSHEIKRYLLLGRKAMINLDSILKSRDISPHSQSFGFSNSRVLLGARVRYSAHGKGHEEGGSTYAKAGSNLRSPPGNPRASTPITRACLLYYFVLLPTSLTLRGAVPHHLFRRRS